MKGFEDFDTIIYIWIIIFVIYFLFNLTCAFICGEAAKRKGLSEISFFWLSFFFSPVIGFLAVIAFPPAVLELKDSDYIVDLDGSDLDEIKKIDEDTFKL